MSKNKIYTKKELKILLDKMTEHINDLLKTNYNEYALLYYQGKLDILVSLVKEDNKIFELGSSFGL